MKLMMNTMFQVRSLVKVVLRLEQYCIINICMFLVETVAPDRMIYTEDEIVAIVCHEMGHWKHGHLVEEMILTTIDINLLFLVFSYVYQNSILYEAFEFPKTSKKPIFLGLHIIVNYLLDIWNFVSLL